MRKAHGGKKKHNAPSKKEETSTIFFELGLNRKKTGFDRTLFFKAGDFTQPWPLTRWLNFPPHGKRKMEGEKEAVNQVRNWQ